MKISLLADHPHESEKIAQWYFDEWAHTAPGMTLEKVIEKVREKACNRNEIPFAFVIHEDQELTGVAELKFRENSNHPEYEHWVGGIYVNPQHRGKGYAGILIARAKDYAREEGIKSLYLQCEDHNIDLYLKHGFRVLHQAGHHEITTTIMVWDSGIES
ncbi:GNAT family N-acetyltransferase [Endozoicomonadaceae bacterium StTr2]